MDRKLYPNNWEAIALDVKEQANWTCQECGKQCWRPGEMTTEQIKADRSTWALFTLTVAHLNHIPSDCRPENLKALCSACHLRYDASQMPLKRHLKKERMGQLALDLGVVSDA